MTNIDELNCEQISLYISYLESQLLHIYEPDLGVFIAETPLVIERALQAGYEPISFLMDEECYESEHRRIFAKYEEENIPIYVGKNSILSKMIGYQLTRGMLCAMRRKTLPLVEQVCKNTNRIVILDDVENPVNVGAIFRSAAALGVDAILLTEGSSDPLYRRASRVGMGAAFQVPWTFIPKKEDYLEEIKALGFKTVAMALEENSISISDERLKSAEKLAIVLGNEGFGLNKETIKKCDYTAMIPMYHNIDSLNVAAAGAVIFWELCGRRL